VKIRLWGPEAECRAAAEALARAPGLAVVSVSGPYADRGASVLVRFYIEARLGPPPPAGAAGPPPVRSRRRTLPPGSSR
jgi:hypothetical protein